MMGCVLDGLPAGTPQGSCTLSGEMKASLPPTRRPVYVSLAVIVVCLMSMQLYTGMLSKGVMATYDWHPEQAEGRQGQDLMLTSRGGYYEAQGEGGRGDMEAMAPRVIDGYQSQQQELEDNEEAIEENAETRCLSQEWVKRYLERQEAILSGTKPPRYLVLQPECGYCGMCNRLNSILGSFLMAVMLGRAFIIDWKWAGRGVAPGTKYLEPRLVNWEAAAATNGKESFVWDEENRKVFKGWGDFDELRDMLVKTDFREFDPWEAVVLHWIGESPQLSLRKNPVAKKLAVEAGVMSEDTEWTEAWDEEFKKCAVRILFKPTKTLTDAYCRVLGEGATKGRGIGIHVRTGDDRTWNQEHAEPTDEHYRFVRCAEGIRSAALEAITTNNKSSPTTVTTTRRSPPFARAVDMDKWHLASDYQKVVDDVKQRYPNNIMSLDNLSVLEDSSQQVRQHSAGTPHEQFTLGPLLDLLLISSGIAVVGTCRSTFSASAAYFGMLPPELTILKKTNFEMRYFYSNDCPEMPEEAEAMCSQVVRAHLPLVEDVLRTPPFITCDLPQT